MTHITPEFLYYELISDSIPGHSELPHILLFLFRHSANNSINLLARAVRIHYHSHYLLHQEFEFQCHNVINTVSEIPLLVALLHIRIKKKTFPVGVFLTCGLSEQFLLGFFSLSCFFFLFPFCSFTEWHCKDNAIKTLHSTLLKDLQSWGLEAFSKWLFHHWNLEHICSIFRFLELGKMVCFQTVKASQNSATSQCARKSHFASLAACLCLKKDFCYEVQGFKISILIVPVF